MAHRARFPPAILLLREILGAVRLARIFHYDQLIEPRQFQNRIHVRALPINMHRNNGGNRGSPLAVIRPARFAVEITFLLQIFLQLPRVHVVRAFVDVHEIRSRARLGNRLGRRNKRMRHRDDHVAGLNARRHQRKSHRVRAARQSDAVRRVAELCEVALEFFHHGAADEPSRAHNLLKYRQQFWFELLMQA